MESKTIQSSSSLNLEIHPNSLITPEDFKKDLRETMFELRFQAEKSESESEIARLKETIKLLEKDKLAAQDHNSRMVSDHKDEMKKLSDEKLMIQTEADLLKTRNAELEMEFVEKCKLVQEVRFLEDLCLHMKKKKRGFFSKKMKSRDFELQKLRSKVLVDNISVFSNVSPEVSYLQETIGLLHNINQSSKNKISRMAADHKEGMEKLSEENLMIRREADLLKTMNTELEIKQRHTEERDNTICNLTKEKDSLKENLMKTSCLLSNEIDQLRHSIEVWKEKYEILETEKKSVDSSLKSVQRARQNLENHYAKALLEYRVLREENNILEEISLELKEKCRGPFSKPRQDREAILDKLKLKMRKKLQN